MLSIIVFTFHILLNFLFGFGVLSLFTKPRINLETTLGAILLGLFTETLLSFFILWLGGDIQISVIVILVLVLGLNVRHFSNLKNISLFKQPESYFKGPFPVKWYEAILLLLIAEKIIVILWQLFRMPTYFSDAIKHWSLTAKAIYSSTNFSMVPNSYEFLGRDFYAVVGYPLQIPIYRAIQATLNFEWNEFVSRSDGFLFFLIICGFIGISFFRFTGKRWMAIGAVYIVASLPLQVWHAASGYADIGVEAFLLAAVYCLIYRKWTLCGVFMAGTIWCKDDGLALYLPGLILAVLTFQFFSTDVSWKKRFKNISLFFVGLATITPWLIFQAMYTNSVLARVLDPLKELFSFREYDPNDYRVVLTQVGEQFQNAQPSYELFWEKVFIGSTHGLLWLVVFVALALLSWKMIRDAMGRSLLLFFISTCVIIFYVFTYTTAYEFLLIETTVHRILLQFSAASLMVLGYGISLHDLSLIKRGALESASEGENSKKQRKRKKKKRRLK